MNQFIFSEVYEDEDGWWCFSVTTPSGDVIESDKYFHKQNAINDLNFVKKSEDETISFIRDFIPTFRPFSIDEHGYFNFVHDEWTCPICGRKGDDTLDEHHLIPKSKKGKETVQLHRVCHDKIHSVFDERELAKYYNTIERIMERDEMQTFATWVAKKPLGFTDPSIMSNRRKNKRR